MPHELKQVNDTPRNEFKTELVNTVIEMLDESQMGWTEQMEFLNLDVDATIAQAIEDHLHHKNPSQLLALLKLIR